MIVRYLRDGKLIGILEDGVLYKRVKESVHLYRKMDAWAVDRDTWARWRARGLHTVHIDDDETGVCYEVDAGTFEQHAQAIEWGDFGSQLALARHYWTTETYDVS